MNEESKLEAKITHEIKIEVKIVILLLFTIFQEHKPPRNKPTVIIISSFQILRTNLKVKWCQKYEPTFRPKILNFEFRWECEVEVKILLAATQREKSGSDCKKGGEIKSVKTVDIRPKHDESNKNAGKGETAETRDADAGSEPPQSPSSDAGCQVSEPRLKVKTVKYGCPAVKVFGQTKPANQGRVGVWKHHFQPEIPPPSRCEHQILHSSNPRAGRRRQRGCCARRPSTSRRPGWRRRRRRCSSWRRRSRNGGGRRKEGKEGREGRLVQPQEEEKEIKPKINRKRKSTFYQTKCCEKKKITG